MSESESIPAVQFDPAKPFYPLITQYLIQLLGWKELALRGVAEEITYAVRSDNGMSTEESAALTQRLAELRGNLYLPSAVQESDVVADPNLIGRTLTGQSGHFAGFTATAASNLLVLAHSFCEDKRAYDEGPLWEFLRHCRNAVTNGGRFRLRGKEPSKRATWRTLKIKHGMDDMRLFGQDEESGLLKPADPILLLWDIEQAYPKLK